MGMLDWLLLAVLAVWLVAALLPRRRKRGTCGGSCGNCQGCPGHCSKN